MVNGGDAQEGVHNGAALIPNLDSIAEFRIITNNFNAEYGNYSGGQINVVTKSGTNRFHGDVFDFLRNTDLDASELLYPQLAAFTFRTSLAEPSVAPSRKTRFFSLGTTRERNRPSEQRQVFPVPSAADRTGNLSDQGGADLGRPGERRHRSKWCVLCEYSFHETRVPRNQWRGLLHAGMYVSSPNASFPTL